MNSSATRHNSMSPLPMIAKKTSASSAKLTAVKVYVEPTENDILRGRGGRINAHPGKQRLLDLVRMQGARYATLKRGQKGNLGKEIVDKVHDWGGRFLEMERESEGIERYYILDERAAIKLVEQKFRDDPIKRKSKSTSQFKKAVKKRVRGKEVSSQSRSIVVDPQSGDDDEDSLVEMELHRDLLSSPDSRQMIAAQVNHALSNLELVMPTLSKDVQDYPRTDEGNTRYHCVSPTSSLDERSWAAKLTPPVLDPIAFNENSLPDSSFTWDDMIETDPFPDPTHFLTDDGNDVDEWAELYMAGIKDIAYTADMFDDLESVQVC